MPIWLTLPAHTKSLASAQSRDLKAITQNPCRFTTYRHRFARAAPAPRAKRNDESWTCIARQAYNSSGLHFYPTSRHVGRIGISVEKYVVAVIPDPRAARSLRFSPFYRFARTVDGYHPSKNTSNPFLKIRK